MKSRNQDVKEFLVAHMQFFESGALHPFAISFLNEPELHEIFLVLRYVHLPLRRSGRYVPAVMEELIDLGVPAIQGWLIAGFHNGEPKVSVTFFFRILGAESNGIVAERLHAFTYDWVFSKFFKGV